MPGQFGYELDLNKLQDYEIEAVKQQIRDYKAYGEVFHKGDLYRLTEADNKKFFINEFISEDKQTVIVTMFCVKATPNDVVNHIKLRGLEKGANYKLEGSDETLSADFLMNFGINKVFGKDYENAILVFKKV
jgi:alpha-galactosidase